MPEMLSISWHCGIGYGYAYVPTRPCKRGKIEGMFHRIKQWLWPDDALGGCTLQQAREIWDTGYTSPSVTTPTAQDEIRRQLKAKYEADLRGEPLKALCEY
jgi:hypothetical protein